MQQFLKIFIDIVLWRRGPQDLPRSTLLAGLALIAYVAVSAVQLVVMREHGASLWLFLVIDPLMLMAWVWAVLALFGKRERYLQTVTAVLGTAAVLSVLLALPLQILAGAMPGVSPAVFAPLFLVLIGVFVAVVGRIIRLASETSLFNGIAVTLAYVVLMEWIASTVRGSGG